MMRDSCFPHMLLPIEGGACAVPGADVAMHSAEVWVHVWVCARQLWELHLQS